MRRFFAGLMGIIIAITATVHLAKTDVVRADEESAASDVVCGDVEINETNFPDEAFRNYVLSTVDTKDKKGVLTEDEIASRLYMDLDDLGIKTLKGIEYFTELQALYCSSNPISDLNLTANVNLEYVELYFNTEPYSADLSGLSKLEKLAIENSNIVSLNCTGCVSLGHVRANECIFLETLNLSGCTSLDILLCKKDAALTSVNLSGCSALTYMDCDDSTALAELDLTDCVKLDELSCSYCSIAKLTWGNMPKLKRLSCDHNALTSLDVTGCPALEELYCEVNDITELKMNRNPKIKYIRVEGNPVTEIEIYSSPILLDILANCDGPVTGSYSYLGARLINYMVYNASIGAGGSVLSIWCDQDDVLITEAPIYSVTVTTDGNGTASASITSGPEYTEGTLTAVAGEGYVFKEWQVVSGGAKIADVNSATTTFEIGHGDAEIKAVFVLPSRTISVTTDGNGTASASVTSAPAGTSVTLTAVANSGYQFKEWQVVSGGVTIADAKSATTTFVVGEADVEIKAIFEAAPTPEPTKDPSFEDFVERLYVVALGRASEAEGKAFWVDQVVNKGFTGADCARFFMLGAPEFLGRNLTDDEFVEVLYKTYFDRDSEPDGKAYWMGRLASGTERAVLVEEFIESVEWCNVCAMYGVKSGAKYHKATVPSKNAVKFATRLYTCCLGRDPEAEGLEYWALALTNLDATGYQAASLFFTRPEFVGLKTTNEEYLTRLYTTFMGREPEAEGFAYWLGLLNGGTDRVDVMKAFAGCPEFQEICNSYGIERGEI